MRYAVHPDGSLSGGRVFFDMNSAPGEEALDGMKVDRQGDLYVTRPGGAWIISPEGKHLGTIVPPQSPHNLAWGNEDGRTLYMTAETSLYRIRLSILFRGQAPGAAVPGVLYNERRRESARRRDRGAIGTAREYSAGRLATHWAEVEDEKVRCNHNSFRGNYVDI